MAYFFSFFKNKDLTINFKLKKIIKKLIKAEAKMPIHIPFFAICISKKPMKIIKMLNGTVSNIEISSYS